MEFSLEIRPPGSRIGAVVRILLFVLSISLQHEQRPDAEGDDGEDERDLVESGRRPNEELESNRERQRNGD